MGRRKAPLFLKREVERSIAFVFKLFRIVPDMPHTTIFEKLQSYFNIYFKVTSMPL